MVRKGDLVYLAVMPNSVNKPGRLLIARHMADLCEARITGKQFIRAVGRIDADQDSILEMVQTWILDEFDPELGRPGFNRDAPPFRILRQFTLFRRFLLSNAEYQWPSHAFNYDVWPSLRLLAAGVLGSLSIFSVPLAIGFPLLAPLAILLFAATATLIVREPNANRADELRQRQRASVFGDPNAWPFTSFRDFRQARFARLQ